MASMGLTLMLLVVIIIALIAIGIVFFNIFTHFSKKKKDMYGHYHANKRLAIGTVIDETLGGAEFQIKGGNPTRGNIVTATISDGIGNKDYIREYDTSKLEIQNKGEAFLGLASPKWVKKSSDSQKEKSYLARISNLEEENRILKTKIYADKDSISETKANIVSTAQQIAKAKEIAKAPVPQ